MITESESIPTRSIVGLSNMDIIWHQFNDINFFIEDQFKENFYFNLLKKLFPQVRFERVFGLGGKTEVIKSARTKVASRKDVHIVDLDFDEILDLKSDFPNLFYLERYSIENYLIEHDAVREFIKEEFTLIRNTEIDEKIVFSDLMCHTANLLHELSVCFLLIRKYELGLSFFPLNTNRDCDLSSFPFSLKGVEIETFKIQVRERLYLKDRRLKLDRQFIRYKTLFTGSQGIRNIPGKYLMNIMKHYITDKMELKSIRSENFNYRLGKNCSFNTLDFLKEKIDSYLSPHVR